jgi:hypothetical protein
VVRTTSHQEQPSSCPERGGSCPAHAHATPSSRTGRSTGRDGVPHHLHGTARTPGGAHRASGASTAWSAGAKRARAWRSSAVRLRCFAVGPNCRVQPVGAGAAPGYAPWVRAPGPAPGSASRPGSHARAAVGRISRPGSMCTAHGAPAAIYIHVFTCDRSKT